MGVRRAIPFQNGRQVACIKRKGNAIPQFPSVLAKKERKLEKRRLTASGSTARVFKGLGEAGENFEGGKGGKIAPKRSSAGAPPAIRGEKGRPHDSAGVTLEHFGVS